MVAEVFAGLSAFSSMFNIAKSMKEMSDANTRNQAVSQLWEHIFEAQTRYAEAVETIRELETRIRAFEDWEKTKSEFHLAEVGDGVKVYAKPVDDFVIEACPSCFSDRHLGILQKQHWDPGRCEVLVCNDCGSVLYLHGSPDARHSTYRPKPYKP